MATKRHVPQQGEFSGGEPQQPQEPASEPQAAEAMAGAATAPEAVQAAQEPQAPQDPPGSASVSASAPDDKGPPAAEQPTVLCRAPEAKFLEPVSQVVVVQLRERLFEARVGYGTAGDPEFPADAAKLRKLLFSSPPGCKVLVQMARSAEDAYTALCNGLERSYVLTLVEGG